MKFTFHRVVVQKNTVVLVYPTIIELDPILAITQVSIPTQIHVSEIVRSYYNWLAEVEYFVTVEFNYGEEKETATILYEDFETLSEYYSLSIYSELLALQKEVYEEEEEEEE